MNILPYLPSKEKAYWTLKSNKLYFKVRDLEKGVLLPWKKKRTKIIHSYKKRLKTK